MGAGRRRRSRRRRRRKSADEEQRGDGGGEEEREDDVKRKKKEKIKESSLNPSERMKSDARLPLRPLPEHQVDEERRSVSSHWPLGLFSLATRSLLIGH